MERTSRSQKYQYVINESVYTDNQWLTIANIQAHRQETYQELKETLEKLLDLDELLRLEMWKLMKSELTDIQYQIVTLISQGLTQWEAADEMGINQSSVHKALRGNQDYQNGGKKYGGVGQKLSKLIKVSPAIHQIMKQMYEIDQDAYTPHYGYFKRTFPSYLHFQQWINQEIL